MIQIVEVGELVAERFRILRFIAAGGMGEVYEAEDQVLDERVALKLLNRRNMGDERVGRRFRREILLARRVTHPNVCRLFDVFHHRIDSGEPATLVTMELLDGETLEERMADRGTFSEDEALPLVRQMAEGLAAAHAVGVVHRDFKTSNVILVPTEAYENGLRAVITDFGLARSTAAPTGPKQGRVHSPLTGEMRMVGTIDYMAPEQFSGEPVTAESDLYALGVVMFEMLAGRRPYEAPNPVAMLAKRVSEPPMRIRTLLPDISPRWEALIEQCMARDPKERPSSGWEVITALTGEAVPFGPSASGAIPRPSAEELFGASTDDIEVPVASAAPARSRSMTWLAALGGVVLLAFALGYLLESLDLGSASDLPWSETPELLTTSEGLELDPAFSPDGERLVYSSNQRDRFELWIRDLGPGGQAKVLELGGGQLFEPTFFPDGRQLAYHDRERGGIWIVDLAVEPLRPKQLTPFGSRPTVNPSGEFLAFQSESSPQLADTSSPALANSTLWLANLQDRTLAQLTDRGEPEGGHAAPSFSPDGEHLVFSTSRYGTSEIWAMTIESRETFVIADNPANGYDPVYALDGRSIYFSAGSRHVNGLWRVSVDKASRPRGEPEQLRTLGLASIRQLAIGPDGERMAYTAMQTVSDLWAVDLTTVKPGQGGVPSPVTRHGGRNNRPDFSPDGLQLAFDRWRLGVSIDLWTLDLLTGDEVQVTALPKNASQPQWSNDGTLIFHSDDTSSPEQTPDGAGGRALFQVDPRTPDSPPRRLVSLPPGVFWVTLSPDGQRIAYHSGAGSDLTLWVADLFEPEGTALSNALPLVTLDSLGTVQTDTEEFLGFPCWSPDGQWIAFQHKRGEQDTQIRLVPASGGEVESIAELPGDNWPFSFSPDGDKIAFATRRHGTWSVRWVSRSTGEERLVASARSLDQYLRYPAWSPEGDLMVYELARTAGDILLVQRGDR